MGKIYEALNRAESEARDSSCTDIEFDYADTGVEDGREIRDPRKARDEGDDQGFNFLRYSLGADSVFENGRVKREAAAASLVRRSHAQPSREVTVDFSRLDPHLATFYNSDRRASEQYNKLALSLISRAAERGFKRVLMASAHHGEGRTTVTLNLACALARARQRVLVADCDLLQPSVMRMLGLSCETGMAEAFSGNMQPGAAAVRVLPFGFNVLPTRKRVDNPVEMLAAPGFWKMLQTFDAEHDFILFDSSPLLEIGDSSLLARFTDTTLMVIRSGRVNSAEMAKAVAGFTPDDILGVVINRAQN
ncbi:MAG TPA: CpsD/CapB family tyrosine-protein kinase [Blastocatellia bacterium]|nr:CpsD/CapB family tyrosine-protein kinase [Blastocatellia bacterium]